MGTLDMPTSGKVFFNTDDITTCDEQALARIRNTSIGFVFQIHHLLPQLNLLENVLMPVIPQRKNVNQQKVVSGAKELLEKVGLGDKLYRFPGQLSVGECQRAAVVRALINKPEVILADEPTGSLDHESAWKLGDLLLYLQKEYELALVVVTHSEELAKRMQITYTLINGRLIAC
jgi:ABC-type lipoprotein export system ATPase subunit